MVWNDDTQGTPWDNPTTRGRIEVPYDLIDDSELSHDKSEQRVRDIINELWEALVYFQSNKADIYKESIPTFSVGSSLSYLSVSLEAIVQKFLNNDLSNYYTTFTLVGGGDNQYFTINTDNNKLNVYYQYDTQDQINLIGDWEILWDKYRTFPMNTTLTAQSGTFPTQTISLIHNPESDLARRWPRAGINPAIRGNTIVETFNNLYALIQ
jgi:hypothetical protein